MNSEENKEKVYPISELFDSFQGEGAYAGYRMFFIRLAGCTVGKPYPKDMQLSTGIAGVGDMKLPIYTEKCTLYDGREFPCDTDYRVKMRLTAKEIVDKIPGEVEHVCITGGEPLMHNLDSLVGEIYTRTLNMVHIETSGTISLRKAMPYLDRRFAPESLWITCSPKINAIPDMCYRANELKILIDSDFNPDKVPDYIKMHKRIYMSAVNNEHTVNPENIKRCIELQQKFPNWIIGTQLHKIVSQYIGERIL